MSYYHIKNIHIDKTKNNISADLADSSLYPLTFYNTEFLCQRITFEETYAEFIYNLVSGNFHPTSNSKFSKLVLNHDLENYYEDAHNIGKLETYYKYKNNIDAILKTNNTYKAKVTLNYNERLKEKLDTNEMIIEYSYINDKIVIKSISFK